MKAALPGLLQLLALWHSPNLALLGVAPPNQSCSGSSLPWSFDCSLSLPPSPRHRNGRLFVIHTPLGGAAWP